MILFRKEYPLLALNTFGIAATAGLFVESNSTGRLHSFIRSIPDPCSAFVLGGGSNVLFASGRCELVIHPVMKGISIVTETENNVWVRAGAGVIWDDLVSWCVGRRYGGLENLSLIPGTVGASPVQNIGAYGTEVKDCIEAVDGIAMSTGQMGTLSNRECMFGYRSSVFKTGKEKYLITAVRFKLSKKFEPNTGYADLKTELQEFPHPTMGDVRAAVIRLRLRKLPDPDKLGNAGSFFKNPVIDAAKADELRSLYPSVSLYPAQGGWKISAAWLISQTGCLRDGNVGVYERQPLVLVNYGGASGEEIIRFAGKVIDSVFCKFGIRLEPEVNIIEA
jgi:UDP-N-acetylmuramate dehydrogenase